MKSGGKASRPQNEAAEDGEVGISKSNPEKETPSGRTFTGIGTLAEYDISTKLGEGTFGYVCAAQ